MFPTVFLMYFSLKPQPNLVSGIYHVTWLDPKKGSIAENATVKEGTMQIHIPIDNVKKTVCEEKMRSSRKKRSLEVGESDDLSPDITVRVSKIFQ